MRDALMKPAIVVAACAVYAAYCLVVASAGIGTSPDSVFYLTFSPIYPTGYPLFLELLGPNGAVIVQTLLFAIALGWLGLETLRQWSSLVLALGVVAASVAVPDLPSLHASLLTESMFMSCEVAMLAAMIRFVRNPRWQAAMVAAAIGGLAGTLRNAGYIFFPVLVVMVLLHWRRIAAPRLAVLAAITVPVVIGVAAERGVAHVVNGDHATSLLGRHLFAKAALLDAPRPNPPLDPARKVIEDHLEVSFAAIRQTIATAPPGIRSLLTVYYETCLQGPCSRQMREASIGTLREAAQNEILVRVAMERIAHVPFQFLLLTARHYGALWAAYKQEHPDTTPILNDFLATHRPLPFEALAFSWREPNAVLQFQADERVRFLQPAVLLVAWVTGGLAVLALVFAVRGKSFSPALTIASLAALTAHAGVLFSATFAPGISRFTVSFWPAVMVSLVFGSWALMQGKGKRLRPGGV